MRASTSGLLCVFSWLAALGCKPAAEAAAIPAAVVAQPPTATSVGPEPGFEGCERACGTHRNYNAKDVIKQPGANPGELARCPVSDAVFDVKRESPYILVNGKPVYACCDSCAAQLKKDTPRFLARLAAQNASH